MKKKSKKNKSSQETKLFEKARRELDREMLAMKKMHLDKVTKKIEDLEKQIKDLKIIQESLTR